MDPARLSGELDTIRGQGYAVADSEVDAGVWGVSVPIFQRPPGRRLDHADGAVDPRGAAPEP